MAIFYVTYSYVPRPAELDRVRPDRSSFFRRLAADGSLLASGQALDSQDTDGMLVIRADSATVAESILDDDPYALAGLVTRRTLVRWNPTIGTWISR